MNILANIFGLGAMLSLFCIYQQKTRKRIILCKLSADIFWIFHYFCLGAFAGTVPNITGVFREIVFFNRKDKKWAQSPLWFVLFIAINILLGTRSYRHWYDIVPIVASCFATVALWLDRPNLTKIISAPASASFLLYDIFVGSYMGIVSESISLVSIALYFFNNRKK